MNTASAHPDPDNAPSPAVPTAVDLDTALADGGYQLIGTRQCGQRAADPASHRPSDDGRLPMFDRSAWWTVAVVVAVLLAALLVVAVPLHRQLGF
jgi:hypothetical protein